MAAVNINLASKEELMKLKEIGEARAKIILTARDKKGKLSLEDLKLTENLPSTIWDPLFQSGKIVFDIPEASAERKKEVTTEVQPRDAEILQKLVEQYKTKLLIAEQDKIQTKRENNQQLEELKFHFNTRLTTKEDQLEKCMREIESEKEKYDRELQFRKEDEQKEIKQMQQELEKVLDKERRGYKETIRSVEDHLSAIITIKENEMGGERKIFEDEKQILLEKIQQQNEDLQTIKITAEKQRQEFKDVEEGQLKKFSMIEDELKQMKTSKIISEKLAPDDIFQGRTTTYLQNPWLGSNKSPVVKESSVTTSTSCSTTPNKPNVIKSDETKPTTDNRNFQRYNEGPSPPKLAVFDGKKEWKPYFMQFSHIANKYKWDKQQKLDKLIECLRDKALKFVSTRQEAVQKDFDLLTEKLNQRFGNKDLPHTIRRQLQEIKQLADESIEEFSEKIQEMAADGYINTPEHVIETISVDAFLKGCLDKKAALFAMEKNPSTIDQALQYVKSSIHNQKILLGYKKPEVKRVQFSEETNDEISQPMVRQVSPNSFTTVLQRKYESMDLRLQNTESHILSIKSDISRILRSLDSPKIDRDRSRSTSPKRSPSREVRCYSCNELGHYSSNCPKKNLSPMRRNRSPSPIGQASGQDLNKQGSKR